MYFHYIASKEKNELEINWLHEKNLIAINGLMNEKT